MATVSQKVKLPIFGVVTDGNGGFALAVANQVAGRLIAATANTFANKDVFILFAPIAVAGGNTPPICWGGH
jgi:hypothetical protein